MIDRRPKDIRERFIKTTCEVGVLCGQFLLSPGDVIKFNSHPFGVVAEISRQEYLSVMSKARPETFQGPPEEDKNHYYRVSCD